jgi:hypothetical protein
VRPDRAAEVARAGAENAAKESRAARPEIFHPCAEVAPGCRTLFTRRANVAPVPRQKVCGQAGSVCTQSLTRPPKSVDSRKLKLTSCAPISGRPEFGFVSCRGRANQILAFVRKPRRFLSASGSIEWSRLGSQSRPAIPTPQALHSSGVSMKLRPGAMHFCLAAPAIILEVPKNRE